MGSLGNDWRGDINKERAKEDINHSSTSCEKISKQILQHGPSFQLIPSTFTIDLVIPKAVVTQILHCAENLDEFATVAAPFDEIEDIDMTTTHGLFARALALCLLFFFVIG